MRRLAALLLALPLLLGAGQPIDPRALVWDQADPSRVAAWEVVQGWDGAEQTATVTQPSIALPVRTGTTYSARVRALPADPAADSPSDWSSGTWTWPQAPPQIANLAELGGSRNPGPLPGTTPPGPLMAAALRSFSATTYASRANTTVTAPTGIQDGDILTLVFLAGGTDVSTTPSITLPSGFSLKSGYPYEVHDSGNFYMWMWLAEKTASGESGDYTVSHSTLVSEGLILCASGASASANTHNSGTGSTSTATGLTTTTNDSLVVFVDQNWQLWGAGTPPTGSTPTFTERLDTSTSLMYVASGVLATAGATGNKTQANENLSTQPWQALLVAYPASGGAAATSAPPVTPYATRLAHLLGR